MSVLFPWLLGAGVGAMLGVLALHLIARDVPPPWVLPTARFVPTARTDVLSRAIAPRDPWLLLLRALTVAALALAGAQVVATWGRRAEARVIVADLSRATADRADVVARATAAWREGDRVIVLDTTARVVPLDSLRAIAARAASVARPGRLSAALVRATDAARTLELDADRVTLVVLSPLAAEQFDAALPMVRGGWRGDVRIERLAMRAAPDSWRAVAVTGASDDPLRATLAVGGWRVDEGARVRVVRVARGTDAAETSAAEPADVLVRWPALIAGTDSVAGVVIDGTALVAPLRGSVPSDSGGRAIAWFPDGRAAAVERVNGTRCVRDVTFGMPSTGDLAIDARMIAIVERLLAPCGTPHGRTPATAAQLATLESSAATTPLRATATGDLRIMRWLLAVAAVLLVLELPLRRARAAT